MDEFMDAISGFRAIEGRLQGSWDAMFQEYCKFYEEYGHGDVPKTEEYKKLSNWCKTQRRNMKDEELKEYRKKLLDEHGFIWNVSKYIFEKNVRCIVEYYNQHKEYPSIGKAIDEKEKNLVYFINNERTKIRNESYPEWKNEIINKYIPDFSWENYSEKSFNRFIYFMKLYMQRNGHVEIKFNEIIDGYKIGMNFNRFLNLYKRNKLSDKKISQLKELGIVFENKNDINFKRKMEIVKQAVNEGIIINSQAKQYKTIDIYEWIMRTVKRRYLKGNLSQEQKNSIEKLVGKSLDKLSNDNVQKNP